VSNFSRFFSFGTSLAVDKSNVAQPAARTGSPSQRPEQHNKIAIHKNCHKHNPPERKQANELKEQKCHKYEGQSNERRVVDIDKNLITLIEAVASEHAKIPLDKFPLTKSS
jgi:hypothetical protein